MGKRLTIEYVREQFSKQGYTLLSEEYISAHSKLEFSSPSGHKHSMTWACWSRGHRCNHCVNSVGLSNKDSISYIKGLMEKEGHTLIDTEYRSAKSKLRCICHKNHSYEISWDGWRSGQRCRHCKTDKMKADRKKSITDIIIGIELFGYRLLSKEYNNAHTKLCIGCPSGHIFYMMWNSWSRGFRCPICKGIKQSIRQVGKSNPSWRGGVSYEPYCPIWKDKEYKDDIKTRDSFKCLNPCCDSNKPNDLTIHHIDYNKKNCGPSNLITVCRSCNSKANTDRKWHTAWYQAILNRRYGYNYGGVKNAY